MLKGKSFPGLRRRLVSPGFPAFPAFTVLDFALVFAIPSKGKAPPNSISKPLRLSPNATPMRGRKVTPKAVAKPAPSHRKGLALNETRKLENRRWKNNPKDRTDLEKAAAAECRKQSLARRGLVCSGEIGDDTDAAPPAPLSWRGPENTRR
ncbi:MAG TPA: hypothetical protein DF383_04105 [Deltaproteobacteria bacterium]|nr:hypothetical protein [Deltaproteobacteria bacterium]